MNNLSRMRVEFKFSKNIARKHRFDEALFTSAGLLDLADAWAEDFDFVQTVKSVSCRDMLALRLRAQTKPFFQAPFVLLFSGSSAIVNRFASESRYYIVCLCNFSRLRRRDKTYFPDL